MSSSLVRSAWVAGLATFAVGCGLASAWEPSGRGGASGAGAPSGTSDPRGPYADVPRFEWPDASAPTAPAAPSSGWGGGGGTTSACAAALRVDPAKELLVVEAGVRRDPRLAFGAVVSRLAPDARSAPAWILAWLEGWRARASVAGAPLAPRPAIDDVILCPWLRATPENACDAGCGYCAHRELDLARAPFELLAVVNRGDLAEAPGCAADDTAEGRLVYSAVDPTTGAPLDFTVIFEFGLPGAGWPAAFHALGALPSGPAYADALAALVARFAVREELHHVRTNEIALGRDVGLPWEMRDFALDGTGALAQVTLRDVPRIALDGTTTLGSHARAHRASIEAGDNALPDAMRAAAALMPAVGFQWALPGVDPVLGARFNANTCNGCHAARHGLDPLAFQHVAPPSRPNGPVRLSRFLDDGTGRDELSRREAEHRAALCACAVEAGGAPPGGGGAYPPSSAPSGAGGPPGALDAGAGGYRPARPRRVAH